MHDYILELSSFFQNRNTSLLDATREIKMTIEVLKALKSTPGKSMDKAEEGQRSALAFQQRTYK